MAKNVSEAEYRMHSAVWWRKKTKAGEHTVVWQSHRSLLSPRSTVRQQKVGQELHEKYVV